MEKCRRVVLLDRTSLEIYIQKNTIKLCEKILMSGLLFRIENLSYIRVSDQTSNKFCSKAIRNVKYHSDEHKIENISIENSSA